MDELDKRLEEERDVKSIPPEEPLFPPNEIENPRAFTKGIITLLIVGPCVITTVIWFLLR